MMNYVGGAHIFQGDNSNGGWPDKAVSDWPSSDGTGIRVLLVDEDEGSLVVKALMLELCDFEAATPKQVLQLMNVPGLTRDNNISSHMQKYREKLKREEPKRENA
ncbi:hypothetical protein HPP92_024589 [Vanilla planifolia]|uniref:Uncharacterized protein n=1 Tax=Vanilla planifolia TaxID=51239 RepID=A0A835PMN5_VANPL|nr:hypothetical protein HPP92_024589 [Vanilla planifolia]